LSLLIIYFFEYAGGVRYDPDMAEQTFRNAKKLLGEDFLEGKCQLISSFFFLKNNHHDYKDNTK
jgi:hypothetical protein